MSTNPSNFTPPDPAFGPPPPNSQGGLVTIVGPAPPGTGGSAYITPAVALPNQGPPYVPPGAPLPPMQANYSPYPPPAQPTLIGPAPTVPTSNLDSIINTSPYGEVPIPPPQVNYSPDPNNPIQGGVVPNPYGYYAQYNIQYQPMQVEQWADIEADQNAYSNYWAGPKAYEPNTFNANVNEKHKTVNVGWIVFFLINLALTIILCIAFAIKAFSDSNSKGKKSDLDPVFSCLGWSILISLILNILHFLLAVLAPYAYLRAGTLIISLLYAISIIAAFLPFNTPARYYNLLFMLFILFAFLCFCISSARCKLTAPLLKYSSVISFKSPALYISCLFSLILEIVVSGIGMMLLYSAWALGNGLYLILDVYVFISYLYITATLAYVNYMICSGVGATYYFLYETNEMPRHPVWENFKKSYSTSFGAAAAAAFITPIYGFFVMLAGSSIAVAAGARTGCCESSRSPYYEPTPVKPSSSSGGSNDCCDCGTGGNSCNCDCNCDGGGDGCLVLAIPILIFICIGLAFAACGKGIVKCFESSMGWCTRYGLVYTATFGVPYEAGTKRYAENSAKRFVNLVYSSNVIGKQMIGSVIYIIPAGGLFGWTIAKWKYNSGSCVQWMLPLMATALAFAMFLFMQMPIQAISDTILIDFSEEPRRLEIMNAQLFEQYSDLYAQVTQNITRSQEAAAARASDHQKYLANQRK